MDKVDAPQGSRHPWKKPDKNGIGNKVDEKN